MVGGWWVVVPKCAVEPTWADLIRALQKKVHEVEVSRAFSPSLHRTRQALKRSRRAYVLPVATDHHRAKLSFKAKRCTKERTGVGGGVPEPGLPTTTTRMASSWRHHQFSPPQPQHPSMLTPSALCISFCFYFYYFVLFDADVSNQVDYVCKNFFVWLRFLAGFLACCLPDFDFA